VATVLSCRGCGGSLAGRHANVRYCENCKSQSRRRPRNLSASQRERILAMAGELPRHEIARHVGVSEVTVSRFVRSTGRRFRKCTQFSEGLVAAVTEAYERHGRVHTEKLFPEVRVRSIVERHPHWPRQLRWTDEQIVEAARMAGLVSPDAQARFFGRPNAYEGSLKALWVRRFGCAPRYINGLPAGLAWPIAKPGVRAVLVRHAEAGGCAPKVLWLDLARHLRARELSGVVEALAGFQAWLHGTDDSGAIIRMIEEREGL
jgi:transposase